MQAHRALPRYIPVADWNKHYEWPTVIGMRGYVARAGDNGMAEAGVFKRVGRRVLVDVPAFFRWVEAQGTQGKGGAG